MSVANRAAAVVVTGTAQSLTALLGLSEQRFFQTIAFRAAKANAGDLFHGSDNSLTIASNQGGYLDAGEAFTVDLALGRSSTSQFWWIATSPGDVLYITRLE